MARPQVSPLQRALRADSAAAVARVLDRCPEDVWLMGFESSSEPPLCCAMRLGCSPEIVRLLLERGADVDLADIRGRTPLHLLTLRRIIHAPKAELPDTGLADLCDTRPMLTSMHFKEEDHRIAALLLAGNASIEHADAFGKTPLTSAIASGDVGFVDLFQAHAAPCVD